MAIVPNTFTANNTPFFTGHQPPAIPAGDTTVDLVKDMVSYNIQVNESPTRINYAVGAASTYGFRFTIKNITENTPLTIELQNDVSVFNITPIVSTFSLAPHEEKSIDFILNKDALNFIKTTDILPKSLKVLVTNPKTESVVLINPTLQKVPVEFLPPSVVIE